MAGINITKSFGSLADLRLVTSDDMRQIGLIARERIVARTLAGVDANGAAFAPYSEGYAKRKAEALGSGGVNLQVSGNMINQLQIVEVTDETVTLGWLQ